MKQFRLLTADDIECRVKKVTDKGAIILLYKTARTDMDILDETVGPENWDCDYREIKGNLYCGIGISIDGRVVRKWDCGIESREDDEGNQKKGEASDSFKRAGFKWGIGRELYTAPFIFIPSSKMNVDNGRTRDAFTVTHIEYDDKRRICSLVIRNDSTGQECFRWKSGEKSALPKESVKPKAPEPKLFICRDCGEVIKPFKASSGKTYGVRELAARSEKKYGRPLCVACAEKVANESTDN